ncbi:MAG: hypothetical protein R6V85_14835 [Polyangia bacterium]
MRWSTMLAVLIAAGAWACESGSRDSGETDTDSESDTWDTGDEEDTDSGSDLDTDTDTDTDSDTDTDTDSDTDTDTDSDTDTDTDSDTDTDTDSDTDTDTDSDTDTTSQACADVGGACTPWEWEVCPVGTEPYGDDDPLGCGGHCCVEAPDSSCTASENFNCLEGSCQGCWLPVDGPVTCEQGRSCCSWGCW